MHRIPAAIWIGLAIVAIAVVIDLSRSSPQPEQPSGSSVYVSEERLAEMQREEGERRRIVRGRMQSEVSAQPNPCSLTADDIAGWSADQITATFHECARLTGHTEDPVDHTVGMIACRTRLRDTARLLAGAEHLFRFTSTALDDMFTDTDVSGNVVTYTGAALEVRDSDGSWLPASYECDYDHGTGEIVDVRTAEGRR